MRTALDLARSKPLDRVKKGLLAELTNDVKLLPGRFGGEERGRIAKCAYNLWLALRDGEAVLEPIADPPASISVQPDVTMPAPAAAPVPIDPPADPPAIPPDDAFNLAQPRPASSGTGWGNAIRRVQSLGL